MKRLVISSLLLIVLMFATLSLSGCTPNEEEINKFATCINDRGAVMYGANWCPHCTEQKEMFGTAFSKINYIECSANQEVCAQQGVEYLPTWKFADNSTRIGVLKFTELSELTGCKI